MHQVLHTAPMRQDLIIAFPDLPFQRPLRPSPAHKPGCKGAELAPFPPHKAPDVIPEHGVPFCPPVPVREVQSLR
jgi:hypothetical protein